jgi:hypothetical protein
LNKAKISHAQTESGQTSIYKDDNNEPTLTLLLSGTPVKAAAHTGIVKRKETCIASIFLSTEMKEIAKLVLKQKV